MRQCIPMVMKNGTLGFLVLKNRGVESYSAMVNALKLLKMCNKKCKYFFCYAFSNARGLQKVHYIKIYENG